MMVGMKLTIIDRIVVFGTLQSLGLGVILDGPDNDNVGPVSHPLFRNRKKT